MLSMDIRKQGGAAIMTIPVEILKALELQIGSTVELNVTKNKELIVRSAQPKKKRYTLKELLAGVTPKTLKHLREETIWAREGDPVGRELV